ncbi:MAG: hypothetical protein M3022_04935 [Actinomycetota bacterium]|nr:hypothetical protein [Actinomycetota bacterium]
MANRKRDSDLFETLRESGLRKRVAKTMSKSAGRGKRGTSPASVSSTIDRLRQAASALESRADAASQRNQAARKAARTRRRNAVKRSAKAKQAADSRAKATANP